MRRNRFTEGQIIGILKEQEVGLKISDLGRKYGISNEIFYNGRPAMVA